MNEEEIRDLIYQRYSNGYVCCGEVSAYGSGVGTFIDVVAVGIWDSTGYEINGFEIKTSRSDFLRELKNPTKSRQSVEVCNRWWIVAPAGVVSEKELPVSWGLLEVKNGKLRQKKEAVKYPRQISMPFISAIMRRLAKIDINKINGNSNPPQPLNNLI